VLNNINQSITVKNAWFGKPDPEQSEFIQKIPTGAPETAQKRHHIGILYEQPTTLSNGRNDHFNATIETL